MSKDGVITALEQGFKLWEREIRRTAASAKRRGASRVGKPDGRVDGKLAQGDRGFQQVITGEARSPLGSPSGLAPCDTPSGEPLPDEPVACEFRVSLNFRVSAR